jgi:mannosyltransferase
VAVVAAPALLAVGLCLYELTTRSLWLDEAASVSIASQHGAALGAAMARDGGNMLGYYGLLHLLIGAFGNGAVVLRLPSAVGAALATALTAALALRLWDRTCALLAGVLAAVSLTLVYWGQDARGYALMMALIAGSFLALLGLLRSEGPAPSAWIAYVALSVAAAYAGLEAILIFPAQLLVLVWYRARARALLSGLAVTGLCAVPLLVLSAQRGSGQLFWVPAPSWRTAKQVADALASSGLQPSYYASAGNALLILTGVAVAIGAVQLWRSGPGRLVLGWLAVPLVLDLAVSLVDHSIFQARYVLVSVPAMALVLAWTVARGGLPRPAAAALLAALIVLRVLVLAPSYGVSSEEWRSATDYVVAATRPGDCIAFYPLDTRMPFEYYGGPGGRLGRSGSRLPRPVLPMLPFGEVRSYVEEYRTLGAPQLAALRPGCRRVWLVWSHEGKLGGPPVSGANYRRLQALRGALAASYPQRATRSFGQASPISIELFALTGAA